MNKCDLCKKAISPEFNFCPHCGTVKPYTGEIRNVGLIILRCLDILRVNCGRTLLMNVLLASKKKYVLEHFTKIEYFGALKNKYKTKEIMERIDFLIEENYIDGYSSEGQFGRPLIKLTERGRKAINNSDTSIIQEGV